MRKSLLSYSLFACAVACILSINGFAYHLQSFLIAETPVREVNVEGRYSMKLPEYLTEGDDLNDEASLQYQNIIKEVYIIVIDEEKQLFIDAFKDLDDYDESKTPQENYARAQMTSIRENMQKVTYESPMRLIKTGCGDAIAYDVAGTQEGIDDEMGFTVAFVEGRLNLYMIMTWTINKTKPTYQADMDNMIKSFKELSGAVAESPADFAVEVNKLYSMTISGGMAEDTSLNSEASLEYADYYKELYVLVIDESIEEFVEAAKSAGTYDNSKSPLDNYAATQRQYCSDGMKSTNERSGLTSSKVNGLDTRTFTLRGYLSGIEEQIFYKVRLVQGEKNFYMVMTWTMTTKRSQNEPAMDGMLNSFKEL